MIKINIVQEYLQLNCRKIWI